MNVGIQRLHDTAVALGASCTCAKSDPGWRDTARLQRYNPNHYGPGPKGGQFAPPDVGGEGGASPDRESRTQVASNDQSIASDARGEQLAQNDTEAPLGIATARAVLAREVASGRMSQAEADQLLGSIEASDAQATARLNAALRDYAGIPREWTAEPTDRPDGVLYRNPDDPKYDNVRIMPGNPQSSNPGQREPYVIDQKSGRFLSRDGTRIPGKVDPEAIHIPLKDYRFEQR